MSANILCGDAVEQLKTLPDASVHCCVTSPPYYGLRDYGHAGQIGLEETPEAYATKLVEVFREVRRVLKDDGTLWLNLGDSYGGSWGNYGGQNRGAGKQRAIVSGSRVPNEAWDERAKHIPASAKLPSKQLLGIPWRVAFALQADGWILRQDIIWHKPNPMPESVKDRCTKAHEYLFLLAKQRRYWFNSEAMKEKSATGGGGGFCNKSASKRFGTRLESQVDYVPDGMRNKRSVWSVSSKPYKGAHFAVFPPALVEPCLKACCPAGGTVLDPFGGSGTTGQVAESLGMNSILIELNPDYISLIKKRMGATVTDKLRLHK